MNNETELNKGFSNYGKFKLDFPYSSGGIDDGNYNVVEAAIRQVEKSNIDRKALTICIISNKGVKYSTLCKKMLRNINRKSKGRFK